MRKNIWASAGLWLTAPRSAPRLALLGAALGAVAALVTYDWRFLLGISPYWRLANGDTGTYLAGWLGFLNDQWRFPLFNVASLGYPEGASVIYTDSIPLLALPGKVVFKLTGVALNYFGPWYFLCSVFQAAVTSLLLSRLSVRGVLDNASGVLIGASATILLARFPHIALNGQFLILLGIYFYFIAQGRTFRPRVMGAWVALHGVALLVQAYLFAMMAPFFLLSLLEHTTRRAAARREAVYWLGIFSATVVGVMAVAGYFAWASPYRPERGYGNLSMNLLSPISSNPDFHFVTILANVTRDATGGQYEGYNYLGFGTLVLVAFLAIARRRQLKNKLAQHKGLVWLSGLFSLFAVTHHVFLGGLDVIHLPLGGDVLTLLSTFRSSGRFFWPVFYLITLGTVSLCRTSGPSKWTVSLVALAAILQVADTAKLRMLLLAQTRTESPALADLDARRELVARHAAVFKYPSFQCAGKTQNNFDIVLAQIAVQAAVPINSVYLGRTNKNCQRESAAMAEGMVPGTLYVVTGEPSNAPLRTSGQITCLPIPNGKMCSDQWRSGDAPLLSRWW